MAQKPIEHGELPQRAPERRAGDPVLIDAIGAHLGAIGPCRVVHDPDARWAHIDLFVCAPERPFTLLATCGMAERPLTTVTGERVWTELLYLLPSDWPLDAASLRERAFAWPFPFLRWLARFPHQTGTGYRRLESVGPLPQPADEPRVHPFEAAVLLGQRLVPLLPMVGRTVEFLAVCPIHADELAWVRAAGTDALLAAFTAADESPILLWNERPSYAPRA